MLDLKMTARIRNDIRTIVATRTDTMFVDSSALDALVSVRHILQKSAVYLHEIYASCDMTVSVITT